jgi:hypothetical protein
METDLNLLFKNFREGVAKAFILPSHPIKGVDNYVKMRKSPSEFPKTFRIGVIERIVPYEAPP